MTKVFKWLYKCLFIGKRRRPKKHDILLELFGIFRGQIISFDLNKHCRALSPWNVVVDLISKWCLYLKLCLKYWNMSRLSRQIRCTIFWLKLLNAPHQFRSRDLHICLGICVSVSMPQEWCQYHHYSSRYRMINLWCSYMLLSSLPSSIGFDLKSTSLLHEKNLTQILEIQTCITSKKHKKNLELGYAPYYTDIIPSLFKMICPWIYKQNIVMRKVEENLELIIEWILTKPLRSNTKLLNFPYVFKITYISIIIAKKSLQFTYALCMKMCHGFTSK